MRIRPSVSATTTSRPASTELKKGARQSCRSTVFRAATNCPPSWHCTSNAGFQVPLQMKPGTSAERVSPDTPQELLLKATGGRTCAGGESGRNSTMSTCVRLSRWSSATNRYPCRFSEMVSATSTEVGLRRRRRRDRSSVACALLASLAGKDVRLCEVTRAASVGPRRANTFLASARTEWSRFSPMARLCPSAQQINRERTGRVTARIIAQGHIRQITSSQTSAKNCSPYRRPKHHPWGSASQNALPRIPPFPCPTCPPPPVHCHSDRASKAAPRIH